MLSSGNRTPDLQILSPTPFPMGHILKVTSHAMITLHKVLYFYFVQVTDTMRVLIFPWCTPKCLLIHHYNKLVGADIAPVNRSYEHSLRSTTIDINVLHRGSDTITKDMQILSLWSFHPSLLYIVTPKYLLLFSELRMWPWSWYS